MPSTSATLLKRVKSATDQAAWDRLFALYTPLLLGWGMRAGLKEADAADLVQEVFVTLTKELPSFDYSQSQGSFRGWLKTIMLNKCRDFFRRRAPVVAGHDPTLAAESLAAPPIEELWENEYRQQLVQQALRIMKTDFEERTWRACWETTVNGRSAREVAAELGISEASVYVFKSRVLKRLREELEGLWE